jgi:predicted Zn-dependent protease with MMP-like domain
MDEMEFRTLVEEEFDAMPARYKARLANVALLVEDEPDAETRETEGLEGEETLLGYYRGVPLTERGDSYGAGATLPDTITLYRLPIIKAAHEDGLDIRTVARETLWHEVAHYFGFDEVAVMRREDEGTNSWKQ